MPCALKLPTSKPSIICAASLTGSTPPSCKSCLPLSKPKSNPLPLLPSPAACCASGKSLSPFIRSASGSVKSKCSPCSPILKPLEDSAMTSPARRHFLQETARLAAEAGGDIPLAELSVYQQLLKQLYQDKTILKAINSNTDKAKAKADMLPAYAEWIAGVLQGEQAQADDKITPTVLIWMIDCGLLDEAMPLAAFALEHKLPSADEFQREMPDLLLEEYADQLSAGYTITGENMKTLVEWATAKGEDGLHRYNVNDNIRAKLLKAAGEWAEEQQMPDYARSLYETALTYNDRVGVKTRITALSKGDS
nr:MAG TPA: small terminase subunit [Caudoviricetes sp.]